MLVAASAAGGSVASHPDWIARGIAAAGVLMALFMVISTRSLFRKQGPLLAFDVIVRAFRHPGTTVVHRIEVRIEVFNVGRMPATIRAVEVRDPYDLKASYVRKDTVADGFSVLAPTEFEVSGALVFIAPDDDVREALTADALERAEINDETVWPGTGYGYGFGYYSADARVRRGDGRLFTNPRQRIYVYEDQSWPAATSPE